MTVYELIQELSKYRADTEVRFHLEMECEIDCKNEDGIAIEGTVEINFDDDIKFDVIQGNIGLNRAIIKLTY